MISHSVCLSFHCDPSHYSTLQTSKPWWQRLTLIKQYESPVLFRFFQLPLKHQQQLISNYSSIVLQDTLTCGASGKCHFFHIPHPCYVTVSFQRGSNSFLRIQHKTPHNRYSQPLLICLLMHLWQQLHRQVFFEYDATSLAHLSFAHSSLQHLSSSIGLDGEPFSGLSR